jgi:hypothetical protein
MAGQKSPYPLRILREDQGHTACEFIRNGGRNGDFERQRGKFCQAIEPREEAALHVPRVHLDAYIHLIQIWMPLVRVELIFNIHESGVSDWEGRKSILVFVPAESPDSGLYSPVDRRTRHQTL